MKKHLAGFALASVLVAIPFAPAHADHVFFSVNSGPAYYGPGPYYPHHYYYAPAPVVVGAPVTWYCPSPPGYYPAVGACYYPWQQVAAPPPAPVVVQQPVIVQQPVVAAPAPVMQSQPMIPASNASRDADDRQLDAFGTEFTSIKKHDVSASDHLRDLETRVETFRQALINRPYFTGDIEQDTEKLQHRMLASPITVDPPVAMGPAAVYSSPGTTGTLPPLASPAPAPTYAPAPMAAPQAPVATQAPTPLSTVPPSVSAPTTGSYNPGDIQWNQPAAPVPPGSSNPYPQ